MGRWRASHEAGTRGEALPSNSPERLNPKSEVRDVLDALELIADERHAFNKSLVTLAREASERTPSHKVTTAAKKTG